MPDFFAHHSLRQGFERALTDNPRGRLVPYYRNIPQDDAKLLIHDVSFSNLNTLKEEALGHASVAFTMDVYSHIISGMQEEAVALLDEVLPPGVSKKNNADFLKTTYEGV